MTKSSPKFPRIIMAQLNFVVGDIEGNTQKIIRTANHSRDDFDADLVVFPELAITAYPPEDLLLRKDFLERVDRAMALIKCSVSGVAVAVGYPERVNEHLYNSVAVMRDGEYLANYRKQKLPNYGVFDEKRYFEPGHEIAVFNYNGCHIGLSICEDIWSPGVVEEAVAQGAEIIINLNASPFHLGKQAEREKTVAERVSKTSVPIVYVNQVGGQDELLFDGASFVMNADRCVVLRAKAFCEEMTLVDLSLLIDGENHTSSVEVTAYPSDIESVYAGLVLAIRDYAEKNGFKGALLGLSGGIDSAVTLALAVGALGAAQVEAVLMPSKYTAAMSNDDAVKEAENLGVSWMQIPIEIAVDAFSAMLRPVLPNMRRKGDVTEENIQARTRGVVLMALSNNKGHLLLTTGNKSEMSVGYATLYGDMAGGFAPLKDVPKMLVYKLARYINREREIIPERVIIRPPSAELAADQKDEDSLPPYEILDAILKAYIEDEKSIIDITALGFNEELVRQIVGMVNRNEYKRRQAPPGVRITSKAFGKERRLPITSGYRH